MFGLLKPASRSQRGFVRLVFIFLLSFSVPAILLFAVVGYSGSDSRGTSAPTSSASEGRRAFLLRERGDYIQIKREAMVEPVGDKDFLLAISMKFLVMPQTTEKTFLLQKYDKDAAEHQGYAIAFARDSDGIHPMVYWRNSEGLGRWFRFASLEVMEKQWFCLVLSFLRGEFLGLHVVRGGDTVAVLGGYRFEEPVYPQSDSDLLVGSLRTGEALQGRLGGMLVVHKVKMDEELPKFLASIRVDDVSGKIQFSGSTPSFFAKGFSNQSEIVTGAEFVSRYRKGHLLGGEEE